MQEIATINSHSETKSQTQSVSLVQLETLNEMSDKVSQTFPVVLKQGQGLTQAEKTKIQNIINEGKQLISCHASSDQLAALINALFGGLKSSQGSADASSMAGAYMIAVEDYSYPVLAKAVKSLIKGQAVGYSKTFLPSSAELADLCEQIKRATINTIKGYERILNAAEEQPRNYIGLERMAELEAEMKKAGAQ